MIVQNSHRITNEAYEMKNHSENDANPVLSVIPAAALIDVPLSIVLSGFNSRQILTIRANLDLPDGLSFTSHAKFITNSDGTLDLSSAVPLAGTYTTADPNGLIWSLTVTGYSQKRPVSSRYVDSNLHPYDIVFTVYDADDGLITTATARRLPIAEGIVRREVRDKGLVATYFSREDGIRKPAIIIVPGSTGGVPEHLAALYASHGYTTLALGYFNAGEAGLLPRELVEIPLEYFTKAAAWLKKQPEVNAEILIIDGTSRGGELALLLGSLFPCFTAVIAWVPSSHIHRAFGRTKERRNLSAWTFEGKPLPFVPPIRRVKGPQDVDLKDGIAVPYIEDLRWIVENPHYENAAIAVENIAGPVMLLSGRDDVMWPSATYSDWIVDRLRQNSFKYDVRHFSYENAGHTIGPPFAPTTELASYEGQSNRPYPYGGTPQGIAAARNDLWPKVLRFISDHVKKAMAP